LQRELDPQAVEEYFALGYVPEPRTIYASAHKLAPGTRWPAARPVRRRAPQVLGLRFTGDNTILAGGRTIRSSPSEFASPSACA
jgi:asparagine synthase (glutamine-hydrolysing)